MGVIDHGYRRRLRPAFFRFDFRSGRDVKFAARVFPRASDSAISPRPAIAKSLRDCAFEVTAV